MNTATYANTVKMRGRDGVYSLAFTDWAEWATKGLDLSPIGIKGTIVETFSKQNKELPNV